MQLNQSAVLFEPLLLVVGFRKYLVYTDIYASDKFNGPTQKYLVVCKL